MTKTDSGDEGRRRRRRSLISPFTNIAFWQFMVFFLLLLIIWTNQLLDLPGFFREFLPLPEQYFQTYLLSLGVILVAIITVGHTYVQQQHTVKGLLKICAACRKVQINEEVWERVEEYVAKRSIAEVSHGLCPTCLAVELAKIKGAAAAAESRRSDREP